LKTIENEINQKLEYPITNLGAVEDIVFFDIETTGFSASNTIVYLIGAVYFENAKWRSIQWLATKPDDETVLLATFFKFLTRFKTVVHFNGQGFDIPYLESKCRTYMLPYSFADYNSIDIYKEIYGMKDILKVENLKQKTIESFLGIYREDKYNGGELISIYYDYVKTSKKDLEALLLKHNFDDIVGMLDVLAILAYSDVFKGKFKLKKVSISKNPSEDVLFKKIATFEIELKTPLKRRITYGFGPFYFSMFENSCIIKSLIYTDELKFFYPNYKDYYYLPEEDVSMHKSVAFYVDKKFRVKAKAANCYSKKTGRFLPQYEEVVTPYFKVNYEDKETYFEVTEEFLKDEVLVKNYILHLLKYLKNKKKA